MTEVNYILTTMTSRSLIIIDELCRSTSVEEGTAIAMAICEDLARSGAYTYITTHFTLLTKLADLFVNIKVWQMQTMPSGDPTNPKTMKLDYRFNLVPGATTLRGYGIYMVRNIWPAEVLQHVDELQGQFIQTTNNPKFPGVDRRVRLKYDLDCKLTKLKLQKKFTVANLNKYTNEYNNEMKKISGSPHNSQIVLQDLHSTTGQEDGLDHSIFNVSKNNAYEYSEFEHSKIYLNDIGKSKDTFDCSSQPELSPIYPDDNQTNLEEEEIVLSPMSTQHSLQTPITSPSKRRMQEIFTPDTNLEILSSQPTYHSVASDQYFGLLAPEVNLSYSASNCSLNLTRNALKLEEGSHIRNISEDPGIMKIENSVYEAISQQPYSDFEHSRNLFKGSQTVRSPIVSYGASQISSCDLSQQLEIIRDQRRNLNSPIETPHPPADLSSELTIKNSEIESPFLNTFVRPLQSDITKTSTPLIRKIQHKARNFGSSSSTSTRTPIQIRTEVTTPKISFTILNGVEDVDMQSIQEDLESFFEDINNEDFHSEEDVNNSKEHTNINDEGSKNKDDETRNDINKPMTILAENTNSEQDVNENAPKPKSINFFPVVTVIEGPNNPSFEEDTNFASVDKEPVIQPIVRNLLHQSNNQEKDNILIKAFNSLSQLKDPLPVKDGNNDKNKNSNKTKYHVNNKNDKVGVEQAEQGSFTSKKKTVAVEEKGIENNVNIDILIEAFNSLSKPRETGINSHARSRKLENIGKSYPLQNGNATEDNTDAGANDEIETFKDKHIDHLNSSENFCEPARDVDASELYIEMESMNKRNVQNYSTHGINKKKNTSKESDENSMIDYYQSAQSSQDMSYSSLNSPKIVSSDATDHGTPEGRLNNLRNTDITNQENNNLSNFYKPILQTTNTLSVSDYDTSTKEMSLSRHTSIEQEGTETEKYINKGLSESNYDTASPQVTQCDIRKSKFYSDLSADSDNLSNYEDAVINPVLKSRGGHSGTINVVVDSDDQSDFGDAINSISPITNHNLNSTINRKELSTDHVSVTDIIQTVNEGILNKYKVDECKEAQQKEMELRDKIRHMTDNTMENVKNKETALSSKENPVPHIPYLSAYSSSSSSLNSNKGNKRVSINSFPIDLNRVNKSKRKKTVPRKRTLGIARYIVHIQPSICPVYKQDSNDLKLCKKSKKTSDQNVIDKENVQQKECIQTTDTISEKNIEGSIENTSSEKDAENKSLVNDNGSEKNKNSANISRKNRRGLKRRKFFQNDSNSSLTHHTQNRAEEEKTITSISAASKLRNLEGDFSSSSSEGKKSCLENMPRNGEDCEERSSDGQQGNTVTSISDASRKRNLDQALNSSSDKRQSQNSVNNEAEKPSSGLIFSESTNKNQSRTNERQPNKPSKPGNCIEEESDEPIVAQATSSLINDISGSLKADTTNTQDQSKLRFLKSSKLSKKAIQEAFYEQDKKFFESSGSSTELAKMWEQRLRRPTVRQIQRSTCLATLRKTEEGVEVIPEREKKKRKFNKKEKILSSSNSSVNMNIFSDKNAKTFDLFIKSDTKDFKSFNFNFGGAASTSKNDGNMFDFKQINSMPSGYNPNRNPSEDFFLSQQSRDNLPFLTQNADFSLTPEGFYKQNRDDIKQLLRKYD